MQWLLDEFRERCEYVAYPGREVSLDEEMIKCLSRYAAAVTQRVKNKPIDFGILVRSLVCASSKYLRTFSFILKGTNVEQSALDLARQLTRRYHRIYLDNLYSRPRLFLSMLTLPFPQYATGTWRVVYGVPSALKNLRFPDGKLCVCLYSAEYLCWGYKIIDGSKEFFLLSTVCPPEDYISYRHVSGANAQVQRNLSSAVWFYNKFMGGVDTDDHMRAMYTTKRRDGKWTNAVFSWVVDRGGLNAYVCHIAFGYDGSHEKWIVELIKSILEAHAPRSVSPAPLQSLTRARSKSRELAPTGPLCSVQLYRGNVLRGLCQILLYHGTRLLL